MKEINVKIDRAILVSDSQTCLSLCSKPSATLDLSTSLIVSRVQDLWAPTMDNLFFAPGDTFSQNVDILTRYQQNIATKITKEFYSPSWMKEEVPDRVTVNVANMRKQSKESLPHLCAQQLIWAVMKNSNLGPNRLSSTLRSCFHKISTRIRIFSPGLENNHILKKNFGNFPR